MKQYQQYCEKLKQAKKSQLEQDKELLKLKLETKYINKKRELAKVEEQLDQLKNKFKIDCLNLEENNKRVQEQKDAELEV